MFKIGKHMESCEIVYRISSDDGLDGVEAHELASIIYSLSDLVQETLDASGNEGSLDVKVRPFQKGSFIAEFVFTYGPGAVSFFTSPEANALANALGFLGFTGGAAVTLPKVIRAVRGKIGNAKDNGNGTFTYGEGDDAVTIDAGQHDIVTSKEVAKSFKQISIGPIKKISKKVTVTVQSSEDYHAGKSTGDHFTEADIADIDMYEHVAREGVPEEQGEIVSMNHNIALNPISGPYDGAEAGYTFKYDNARWSKVQMRDPVFRPKLESGEIRLHERDVFVVDMEITQAIDRNGNLKVTDRAIVKVRKYIPYDPSAQFTIDEMLDESE